MGFRLATHPVWYPVHNFTLFVSLLCPWHCADAANSFFFPSGKVLKPPHSALGGTPPHLWEGAFVVYQLVVLLSQFLSAHTPSQHSCLGVLLQSLLPRVCTQFAPLSHPSWVPT